VLQRAHRAQLRGDGARDVGDRLVRPSGGGGEVVTALSQRQPEPAPPTHPPVRRIDRLKGSQRTAGRFEELIGGDRLETATASEQQRMQTSEYRIDRL
jgi:hypothetical protein